MPRAVGVFAACSSSALAAAVDRLRSVRRCGHQEPDWSFWCTAPSDLGLLAGGALALAGALFQAMLRDALATPYTLGISAGASLGAVVSIWLGWQQIAGLPAIWITALAGSAIVLAVVVGAAMQQRRLSSFSLLLSGLAANSVCSAFIIVIYGIVGANKSFSISRLLIGGRRDRLPDARRLRGGDRDRGGPANRSQIVEPDGRDLGNSDARRAGDEVERLRRGLSDRGTVAYRADRLRAWWFLWCARTARIIESFCPAPSGGGPRRPATIGRIVMALPEVPAGAVMAILGDLTV